MFDWIDLLRKDITLPININWKIKYFTYKQFTIEETLDFFYGQENKVMWLFNFLNKNWAKKKYFWRYKLTQKEFMSIEFELLYKTVVGSLMKWFYDFETKSNTASDWDEYPIWAYIALILKETPMEFPTLLKLTFQQLKVLSDWIIWNLNMQSEEWQKRNKKTLNKNVINKLDDDKLQDSLKKLEAIHNKQVLEAKHNS
jgi:hypothetical protein